jgi:hypothetical protein
MTILADVDVMRQCRKLELALQPNGWRGNVEEEITKEFYATAQNILILDDLQSDIVPSDGVSEAEQLIYD